MSSQTEESQWSSERTKVRTRVIDPRGANGAGLPLCIEPMNPVETADLLKWIAERKEQLLSLIHISSAMRVMGTGSRKAATYAGSLASLR